MNEQDLELEIQKKGLNAPRLTPDDIDAVIADEQYHVFPGTTLTVCALTLKNGFQVTGESAAVSFGNFDPEIGRQVARKNAREKIWALEGYLLKQRLNCPPQELVRARKAVENVRRAYFNRNPANTPLAAGFNAILSELDGKPTTFVE
jgi:hypothetical protein